MMNLDCYIHITSPIRRLVDLLNIIKYQINTVDVSDALIKMMNFYNHWIERIDFINMNIKKIKKVQNDSMLYHICCNSSINNTIDGYIIDIINLQASPIYKYSVYLPELKMVHSIKSVKILDIYTKYQFKLYIFKNEDRIKMKVRLMLL